MTVTCHKCKKETSLINSANFAVDEITRDGTDDYHFTLCYTCYIAFKRFLKEDKER